MGHRTDPYAGLTQLTTGTNDRDAGLTTFPASEIPAFILPSLYKKISYSMSLFSLLYPTELTNPTEQRCILLSCAAPYTELF
jgi:hypothetical protein